jgi:hypothetical protein
MRMICETFHCVRKHYLSKTASNVWIRYFISIIGNSSRILPVMRPEHDDFLGF